MPGRPTGSRSGGRRRSPRVRRRGRRQACASCRRTATGRRCSGIDFAKRRPGRRRQRPDTAGGERAQCLRGGVDCSPQTLAAEVARIAGEQLVAAIAGQRDRDVGARHLGHEIGRDLRRVGKRLVVHVGELRDDIERMARFGVKLGMLGPEMRARRRRRSRPRCTRPRESRSRRCAPVACSAPASARPPSMNRCRPTERRRAARRPPCGAGPHPAAARRARRRPRPRCPRTGCPDPGAQYPEATNRARGRAGCRPKPAKSSRAAVCERRDRSCPGPARSRSAGTTAARRGRVPASSSGRRAAPSARSRTAAVRQTRPSRAV